MRMEQLTKEISELQNELSELENKECGLILTESEENNISKLEEKIFDAEVVHIKINKPTIVDVVLLDDKGRYSIEGYNNDDIDSMPKSLLAPHIKNMKSKKKALKDYLTTLAKKYKVSYKVTKDYYNSHFEGLDL